MKTFEELKALLKRDLLGLEQLAGNWPSTIEERHVKEQEIGRQCFETEEDLSQLELNTLKRPLASMTTGGEHTRLHVLKEARLASWHRMRLVEKMDVMSRFQHCCRSFD